MGEVRRLNRFGFLKIRVAKNLKRVPQIIILITLLNFLFITEQNCTIEVAC
jgi:hypothetical protein